MWPTIDGIRILQGAEADLVRRAVSVMLEQLVAEYRDDADVRPYGIDWFDQWDAEQRIWLLEHVAAGLFTSLSPDSPAAMWEATVDAIFCEVVELITTEIDAASTRTSETSWRDRVVDAFCCQHGRSPNIEPQETDITLWRRVVIQVADAILGVTVYQKAESLRDTDIEKSRSFLMQKGMPEDFLQRIPPLRTPEETEQSITRIESIVQE